VKRLVSEGRGLVVLWAVLALLSVAGLAMPALAADVVPAPAVEVMRQEWGLPLTIAELAGLVVVVVPIVIGCVQAAKQFGVKGKASFALALGLGLVIGGLVVAASLGILPPWAGIAIVIVLGGLLAGLAATGIYDLQSKSVKVNEQLADQLAALATEKALGCGTVTPQESRYDNLPTPSSSEHMYELGNEITREAPTQPHPRVYDGPHEYK